MARGALAKTDVTEKIKSAFGKDFIGVQDNKLYVYGKENGEKIQIAIGLTCPKVPIVAMTEEDNGDWDFSDPVPVKTPEPAPAEITEEEKQNLADLMAKLGL